MSVAPDTSCRQVNNQAPSQPRYAAAAALRYIRCMQIPHTELAPATLRAIVTEFVTRDGTDHSTVDTRIARVLQQLDQGRLELHFDEEEGSCNLVPVDQRGP